MYGMLSRTILKTSFSVTYIKKGTRTFGSTSPSILCAKKLPAAASVTQALRFLVLQHH
jgi:hypothetical protein